MNTVLHWIYILRCEPIESGLLRCLCGSLAGGDLYERLAEADHDLMEEDCIHYIRQVCQGVAHMHKNNIIHLDIKVTDPPPAHTPHLPPTPVNMYGELLDIINSMIYVLIYLDGLFIYLSIDLF